MRILVTGSDGMIGSQLCTALQKQNHEVIRFGDSKDIRKSEDWLWFASKVKYDFIIHLAALAGVRPSIADPVGYYDNNVGGMANMLHFAADNATRILYASSSNAHEWWGNPYATTKMMNEIQAQDYNAIGMRFHTVWPGRDDMLFKKLSKGEVSTINSGHKRDFVHIDDIISAITLLLNKFDEVKEQRLSVGASWVDIGTGESVDVKDVALAMGFEGEYNSMNPAGERVHTEADIRWLESFGWRPTKFILEQKDRIL